VRGSAVAAQLAERLAQRLVAAVQLPVQVTFRNVARSEALEALIREHAAGLEHFHTHLVSCRVAVELAGHGHKGRAFQVRVDLKLPGGEIAADHQHDEDPHVAVREAFHAARRMLEDHVRRTRGDVKRHAG
jgi:ribosome-associated translation inhibitor RaiA